MIGTRRVHLILLALLLPGCHRGERRGAPRDITVFVAASLVPAFQELADTMHARDPALIVRLNGAASSSLVSQLEQMAPEIETLVHGKNDELPALVRKVISIRDGEAAA